MGDQGAKQLATALAENRALSSLDIRTVVSQTHTVDNCNIGAEGGKALGLALKANRALGSLDISPWSIA